MLHHNRGRTVDLDQAFNPGHELRSLQPGEDQHVCFLADGLLAARLLLLPARVGLALFAREDLLDHISLQRHGQHVVGATYEFEREGERRRVQATMMVGLTSHAGLEGRGSTLYLSLPAVQGCCWGII